MPDNHSAPARRPTLRRAALLALALAILLGGWLALAPAPAHADDRTGYRAALNSGGSITPQLGPGSNPFRSFQTGSPNLCSTTAYTYARNGGWNLASFRIAKGSPCGYWVPTWNDAFWSYYEIKVSSSSTISHGTANAIPGADIEYISGLNPSCGGGSWRNVAGETYNRIYAHRSASSPDGGTYGPASGACNNPNAALAVVNFRFSVPPSHSGDVYLTLSMERRGGTQHGHFVVKYNAPTYTAVYPIAFPQNSDNSLAATDVSGPQILTTGTRQRAAAFLRTAAHGSMFSNSHTNVARSKFTNATIKIASDPQGASLISNATISNSSGAKLTACTESSPGNTCTVASANWPAGSGTDPVTNRLDFHFTVPAAHTGPAYVVVGADLSGTPARNFALQYQPQVAAYPLAAPYIGANVDTSTLASTTRSWATLGASQRAIVVQRTQARTAYDSTHANVARSAFSSTTITVASDAAGANPISGAKISSDAAGNTAITECTETSVGNTCTVPSGSFPQGSGTPPVTSHLDVYFSVPNAHEGDAYLVVTTERSQRFPRAFALKYEEPVSNSFPLIARAPGGDVAAGTVTGTFGYAEAGAAQQAAIFLRNAAHGDEYDSTDANINKANFDSAVIKVTSDADGVNVITGAKISGDSAGANALSACTETSAGDTCTITSANWPGTGAAGRLDLWFSVPAAHTGDAYLHIAVARTGTHPGLFALKYLDSVAAHPLAMPAGTASGTNVSAGSRTWAAAGAAQQATVNLRAAAHSGIYTASAANAPRDNFDDVEIVVASDPAGANAISGAEISSDSAGNTAITACTESGVGNTCTITSANFPQATSGSPPPTLAQNLYFSVPAAHFGSAYLVVKAQRSGLAPRVYALTYRSAVIGVGPLAVPAQSTDGLLPSQREGQDISTLNLGWRVDSPTIRAKVFLRAAAHSNTYRAADANVARAAFDRVRIRLATSATGGTEFSGATLIASDGVGGTSICNEQTAGPTCTINAANWPVDGGLTEAVDLRFVVTSTSDASAYLHVSAMQSGSTARTFSFQYTSLNPPAHPLASPVSGGSTESGNLATGIRSFRSGNERQQVRVALRDVWHGNEWDANDANAERSEFSRATITIGAKPGGVFGALTGAAIYNAATGSTALTPCTENTAGPTCTITSANFPVDSGTPVRTEEVDLWFSVPAATAADAYVRVAAESSTGVRRIFDLKYEPYLRIWPLVVPTPSATRENGNVKTNTRNWPAAGDIPMRADIFLRSAEHSNTYTSSHTNVERSDFDSVELRLATAEDGTTSASGPVFTNLNGNGALSGCTENARDPVCTITSANWPQATTGTPLRTLFKSVFFTVPDTHDAVVWLVARVKKANKADRVFSVRFDIPYNAYPLVVPGGTADNTDLGAGSRNFLPGGATQQASIHLRDAWHDDTYDASDANAPTADLAGVIISIASDAAGTQANRIASTRIASNAAGTGAVTGCSGSPTTNNCTITAANWPATSGTTDALDLYFSVPNTVSTAVYVVVTAVPPAGSGKNERRFALKYDPPLPVFPLAVPLGAADAHEGGVLTARTENYASAGARQKARIYLRNAWHSNTYASTGQTNAPTSDFSSVTIRIADGSDGGTAVSGATITNASGARLSQCAAAGATCLVNSWPASAGAAQPLDIWFSVPDSRRADVFLHVTVRDSDGDAQTFAIPYENPHIEAWPLIVPQLTSTTFETGTLSANSRHWWPYATISTTSSGDNSTGRHWLRLFLRDEERTAYGSAHANAAAAEFDATTLQITSDAAGQTLLGGAAFTTAAGRSRACGNSCPDTTTPAADETVYFKIPDSHAGPVYIRYGVTKSGKIGKTYTLKYDPPPTVAAHPILTARESDGSARAAAGEYSEGAADRVRLSIRDAAASATSAATSTFLAVTITAASDADGTALSGAVLSADAAGTTALSGCTEGSTAGNACTISSWPATGGLADDLDLYVTVPAAHAGALYVHVNIIAPAGIRNRAAVLKYDPYLRIWPLVVPAPAGTPATGNVKTATRDWAAAGAANRAQVFLRNAAHSNAYSATGALVARSAFDRVILRLATAEDGSTSASGPVFTGSSGGSSVLSACSETSQGPVCTIPASSWPQAGTPMLTTLQDVYFTVPGEHGSVWLVATVQESGKQDRVFSIRYDSPVNAYALVVPAGTADGANLAAGARNFVPGGVAQQATVYMRSAWHDDEYNAADANAAASVLTSATITIASDTAGQNAISGAEISSDPDGNTALGSGCTTVTNSCTITTWPATGGLSFYFSVPNTVSTSAYVVVSGVAAASGKAVRATALEYAPPLPVFPLAVPRHPTTDAHESGTLTSRTGNFAAQAARNKATIYLRDAWHSNAYAATGQDNAPASDFSSVTIRIATGSDGSAAVSGAAITNASGARLPQCAAAGPTCLIGNWPATAGTADPLDIWFSVPDARTADAYLHVTVRDSDGDAQTFAIPYQPPYVAAWPLIVPKPGGTYETGTLSTATRRWLPEGGLNLIGFFFRDRERTAFDGNDASPATGVYDGHVHTITSDAAGNNRLSGAAFTDSAGNAFVCGNRCTASWLQGDLRFRIPDSHAGAVYIHLSATKPGKLSRSTSLKWDPPLTVSAHPSATPLADDGSVAASAGRFNSRGLTDRARISVRAAAGSATGAATTAFDSVKLTLASDADGTALTGAKLAANSLGTTALTGCSEGSTAGNVCTIPAASWPATAGAADELELYFTVPLTRIAAVYLHVRVEKAGERDRTFSLKYDAPVGAQANTSWPFPDPRLSDGTREQDDDGDGLTDNERYYQTGAAERIQLGIYETSGSGYSATAAQAAFHSLDETSAITLSAVTTSGTTLGATHISFTQSDGSTALGCSEASYAGGTCTLARDAWQALLGLTGADDSRRSHPFEFAFTIKTAFTNTDDVRITALATHHDSSTTSRYATYKRGAAAASNAQPFARPIAADGTAETGNVLMSEDAQAHRFRRYRPGGQDTPVQLLVYDSATAINTYSSSTNRVSYGTVSEVKIEVKTRPTANSLNSGSLITGALVKVLKNDGASACTEAAVGNTCTITSANFLAAGPPRAGNHYRALPLEFHFSVPSGHVTPNFGNANLVVTVVRTGSGTLAQRTKTFALPFDGGTRARPFAMAADQTGAAPADNQQYAPAGALTPVWLHVYNSEKSAHEAPSPNNTAQYWEFDQTAGATVLTIELLDQDGRAHGTISAAGSAAKFAPCTESRPGPTCSITLPALKALDAGTVTDDDHVDPLRFSVSVPYGSADSVRIKATVRRSDEVPGQSGVKQTKTGEFTLYAPPAYGLALPLLDGAPATGAISDRGWEYLPRGRPTPLALQLRDAPSLAGGAGRAHLQDFETVTIRALQPDGAALAGAKITARSGSALAACSPAAAVCEVSRAEWPSAGAALADRDLRFALAVPAAYQQAAVIRVEVSHSRRNPPAAALPATERTAGAGPLQTIGLADDAGTRTAYYELRLASPVKRAFALALTAADAGALRLCTKAETEDGPAACAAPSAQRGAPLGFAAAIVRTASAHPADPPSDSGDELVEYREISELRVRATGASVHHRALCPRAASEPEHPQFQPAVQSNPANCTISSDALRRFHGDDANDPIRPLQLALIPTAAGGRATVEYAIAGGAETILRHLDFTAAPGSPQLAAALFLDWADPGSDFDAARPEALFTIGRKDSRAAAVPAPASALPGGLAPATFAQAGLGAATGSVQLSINQGSLSFADRPCSAAGGPCALAIAAAELRGSADPADPVGTFHAEYRLPFDAAGPTTVSIAVRNAAGGAAAEGALAIEHPSASRPAAFAALPADADASAAPGGPAIELAAGLRVALAAPGPGWSCLRADPSFLELDNDGTAQNACALARTAAGASATAAWLDDASYLALSGPAAFDNGAKRLPLGGTNPFNQLRCGPAKDNGLAAAADRDLACWAADAQGNRPKISIDPDSDGSQVRLIANLVPAQAADGEAKRFTLLAGDGATRPANRSAQAAAFLIAGSGDSGALFLAGPAAFSIAAVQQAASASLQRSGADPDAPVRTGEPAALSLAVLNANGQAAEPAAISSITLIAAQGMLRAGTATDPDAFCDGRNTCAIPLRDDDQITGNDLASATRANPRLPAAIPVQLYGVAAPGAVQVSAAVVATDGAQPILAGPVSVEFAGRASSLALGQRLQRLHSSNTVGDDPDTDTVETGDARVDQGDLLDQIKISVSAADAGGRAAPLPRGISSQINGPASDDDPLGPAVPANRLNATLDQCNPARTMCSYLVDADAPASDPLPSGVYTLTASIGSAGEASARFGVAGPPASIQLQAEPLPAIGATFTVQITVTDAQNEPVADGTPITLNLDPRGDAPPAAQLASTAQLATQNGQATARLALIGREISILQARAGQASKLHVIDARQARQPGQPQPPSQDGPAARLSSTQPNDFALYRGAQPASAAALAQELGPDAAIFFWNGKQWLRFATRNNTPIPGSANFPIHTNDILWITH